MRALLPILALAATGCGGAQAEPDVRLSRPALGPEDLPAPEAPFLALADVTLPFSEDVVLALSADGSWTINGEYIGRFLEDGSFVDEQQATVARLDAGGDVLLDHGRMPLRIEESRMVADNGNLATFAEDGTLTLQGSGLPPIRVHGVTARTRRTTLYMLALFIGLMRAEQMAGPETAGTPAEAE
jgi:hypothetical protein